MTKSEIVLQALGYSIVFVACLGWMDIGQGREYTWWNMIVYIANYNL
jgi:hypothetical protein